MVSITDSMDMNEGKVMFIALGVLQFTRSQRVRQGLVTQPQQRRSVKKQNCQLTGWRHSTTHQQTLYLKTYWAHSCPYTQSSLIKHQDPASSTSEQTLALPSRKHVLASVPVSPSRGQIPDTRKSQSRNLQTHLPTVGQILPLDLLDHGSVY